MSGHEPHVNEATVEALRMRISTDVHGRFLKSIGLSGGVGFVFSALTLGSGLQQEVLDTLRESTVVQETIEQETETYLSNAGSVLVRGRVQTLFSADEELAELVAETTRGHLTDVAGQVIHAQVVQAAGPVVDRVVTQTLTSGGPLPERIGAQLRTFLASERGHALCAELLGEADPRVLEQHTHRLVHDAMKGAANHLGAQIQDESADLVSRISSLAVSDTTDIVRRPVAIDKAGHRQLQRIADLPPVDSNRPVTLILKIRRGPRYAAWAIEQYLDQLERKAGDAFQLVLFFDHDNVLLAATRPDELRKAIAIEEAGLMTIVNATELELDAEEAREGLARALGPESQYTIRISWSVREALQAEVWRTPSRLDQDVPVVDDAGVIVGTTTRGQLVDVLLD